MRIKYNKIYIKHKPWYDDITIIIKAFERPKLLRQLVESIHKKYPKIHIKIADDSRNHEFTRTKYVDYYPLPYDTGLGAGRNFLADKVKTKYFLLLDDDHIFIEKTNLKKMYNILEKHKNIDLIAGLVKNITNKGGFYNKFDGMLEIKNNIMCRYAHKYYKTIDTIKLCDITENFFLAKTKKTQQVRWDDRLKISEHGDFFLRAKQKKICCGIDFDVEIGHDKRSNNSVFYSRHRGNTRMNKYRRIWMKKHGIKSIIVILPNGKK